ncbi:MAG: D-glycerate dehydrogenase [Patescibacteria group bacterium]|nr:MAG: D-glycerate dehydrogenase [Patescibacteria group bacterium]
MSRVFVTREIPDEGLKLLEGKVDLEVYDKDQVIPRAQLLEKVKGIDALLPLLTDKIDAELMDAAGPQLKVIANYAVGFDNIDVKAATQRKIYVANTPGVLTEAVAEHAFGLLLAIGRRIPEADRFTRAGNYKGWEPMLLLGTEIKGKTLGVVGLGRIGSRISEMAVKGMGMKVIYYDVKQNADFEKEFEATYKSKLDDLLSEADFVTIHVPLLPATRHLIDAEKLSLMKKTAYLINTSRGPVVDEKALVEALKSKTIAGAALDVYEEEPRLAPGLADLENVVLTPHTASATNEARGAMSTLAAQAILDVLSGKPPQNLVNKELS